MFPQGFNQRHVYTNYQMYHCTQTIQSGIIMDEIITSVSGVLGGNNLLYVKWQKEVFTADYFSSGVAR